jgi:glycosyltransferase involved in cell wall biosynthesis
MRLLIATEHLGIVGGVETYLRAVLPRLAAAGFEVGVLAAQGSDGPGITAGCPDAPVWLAVGRPVNEVARDAERWSPVAVYQHGLADPALEAALAARFPSVLFAHNYHGTCVSGTKCHSRPEPRPCQRPLGLGCLAAYFPRGCGGRNPITMLRLYSTQKRRRANLGMHRAVLVASRHMVEEYRRHGVEEGRLRVAPLFPTDATPDPTPPAPRPWSGRVLFVGRITPLKGLLHLVRALPLAAAELARRLTLVVAGDGPERYEAEVAAKAAGLPAEFLGWVEPERRMSEMRAADVLAMPSVWPEPFGLVGAEAGCVGLPAAGYATGGIPDWLIPGVSGESAPGERPDPKELAAALVRALADDTHRHHLAIGAWQTARRFSPEAHVRSLSEIFQSVTRAAPGSAPRGGP